MGAVIWWMTLRKQEHRLRRIKKGIRDFPNKNAFVYTNAYLAKDPAYIILQKEGGHMSSNKRDITKIIRLNGREYQMVMENANACNMNFSTYVRYAISNVKMPNPEMRKLILKLINEVNHIGNNINQIVRNNNSGLYLDSDKTRLMEYMRLLNFKVGALAEKYGD